MRRVTRLRALLLTAAMACGSDATPVPGDGGGTEGSGEEGSAPADDDDDSGSESNATDSANPTTMSGGSDSTGTDPDAGPTPARGIALTAVYANQGVEIPIVVDGAHVDVAARNAQIVKGRNMLVRGLWALDDGFAPREIEATITLTFPDGSEEVASKTFMVAGPSNDADLDSNIWFVLPAEFVRPGVEFQLELFETEAGHEDEPASPYPAYPAEPGALGVLEAEMVLKSVIVPVHHNLGSTCPFPPNFDEQTLQPFIDELYMQNPVESVEIEVRDSVEYTGSLGSFNGLLGFLADLRVTDNADPAAYYYGVVRPCDGGPDGVGGQAISIPAFPSLDNAWTRVAVGRWSTSSVVSTASTYVHEIGHVQGRRHVACSGQEGGADGSYPYAGGDIGVWGFGVLDFSLHTPTNAKDYMTYCGNTWVSDWGWENVVPFVQEITSWDVMDAPPPGEHGELLVGLIDPSAGDETWFVTKGSATNRVLSSAEDLTVTTADGRSRQLHGTIGPMGDGDAYAIAVPLPANVDLGASTRLLRADGTSVASVRRHGELITLRHR